MTKIAVENAVEPKRRRSPHFSHFPYLPGFRYFSRFGLKILP